MSKISKKQNEDNVIHVTKNYDMFKTVKGNREIDKGHVARLKKEIKKRDLDLPIFINEHDEVVDGQHTLQARKELGYSMWRETRNDFKQGKFKMTHLQRCNDLGGSLMFMKNNFGIKLTRSFITAFAVCSEHPRFKWERFKTALKSKSALLLRGTNTEDFIRVFDKIYNGNMSNKINFIRYFVDREYQEGEINDK